MVTTARPTPSLRSSGQHWVSSPPALISAAGFGLLLLLAWFLWTTRAPRFSTEYQAVLLANGGVYFGRIERLGTNYPILRDVYYLRTASDPQGSRGASALVKRGKEMHQPDFMVLNRQQITLIEPVTAGSQIADLIREARQQK